VSRAADYRPLTAAAPFELGALDWQEHSVCQWTDEPGLFDAFSEGSTPREWERVARAQNVCVECPVRAQCLEFGISLRESGVYGGRYLSKGHVLTQGAHVRKPPKQPTAQERAAA
jgi:hypothetical protein